MSNGCSTCWARDCRSGREPSGARSPPCSLPTICNLCFAPVPSWRSACTSVTATAAGDQPGGRASQATKQVNAQANPRAAHLLEQAMQRQFAVIYGQGPKQDKRALLPRQASNKCCGSRLHFTEIQTCLNRPYSASLSSLLVLSGRPLASSADTQGQQYKL